MPANIIIMCTWTTLVIFLCGALTPALGCDWLIQYGRLSSNSRTHICLMGGPLTEQESPVHFPRRLYSRIRNKEVESQLVFIRDSLELILDLYDHHNVSSVPWNVSQTERFMESIHRQIDGLNTCVSTTERRDKKLRKYYRNLKRTLYRTGGSAASWEQIRKETKLHLDQLDLLVSFIRKTSSAPTPRQP